MEEVEVRDGNLWILSEKQTSKMEQWRKIIHDWAEKHQVAIGVAEMAVGAAALAYGVNTGAIEMGRDFVATATAKNWGGAIGTSLGLGLGAGWWTLVGGIGLAAGGGAVGIPAAIIVGGPALVLGAFGYTLGDILPDFLSDFDFATMVAGGGLMAIGIALLLDGFRRACPKDIYEKMKNITSKFANGVISFWKATGDIIAETLKDLLDIYEKACKTFAQLANDPKVNAVFSNASIIGGATAGAVIGTTAATSTVTVLGFNTLGSVALGLGLVSAPIWPVIAIGAAGAISGCMLWAVLKSLFFSNPEDLLLQDLALASKE